MESRRFARDTLANALGTIIAVAVIYLGGVITGEFVATAFGLLFIALGAAIAGLLVAVMTAPGKVPRPLYRLFVWFDRALNRR